MYYTLKVTSMVKRIDDRIINYPVMYEHMGATTKAMYNRAKEVAAQRPFSTTGHAAHRVYNYGGTFVHIRYILMDATTDQMDVAWGTVPDQFEVVEVYSLGQAFKLSVKDKLEDEEVYFDILKDLRVEKPEQKTIKADVVDLTAYAANKGGEI